MTNGSIPGEPRPPASAASRPAPEPAAEVRPAAPFDRELAGRIDHTLLKPDATGPQFEALCAEARRYGFATVCVPPNRIPLAARLLAGSGVGVCAVIGFPLGHHAPEALELEARLACRDGATELDMVIPVGALKEGDDAAVRRAIRAVTGALPAASPPPLVKVILECALLTDAEKRRGCRLAVEAGAAFVKTSTGFGPGGATEEDVRLLRAEVGPGFGVKAAGGIRDREAALRMIAAGADRIGASASVRIVQLDS